MAIGSQSRSPRQFDDLKMIEPVKNLAVPTHFFVNGLYIETIQLIVISGKITILETGFPPILQKLIGKAESGNPAFLSIPLR
jgi:hypothetical protein